MNRELPDGFLESGAELPSVGIDRHRVDDEVYQQVPEDVSDWARYRMADDGLPTVEAPTKMPFAPPLSTETLCCIADTSKFVLRDGWGKIIGEFQPEQVERTPDGRYRVTATLAGEVISAKYWNEAGGTPPDAPWWRLLSRGISTWVRAVTSMYLSPANKRSPWWSRHFEVEPVRPQCRHFARQMSDFQDNDDHIFLARVCTARRDSSGEFLSLHSSQMFACELRDPVDEKGALRVEQFDEAKIRLGRRRVQDGEAFDVDGALDGMMQGEDGSGDAAGGIFRTVE